MRVATRGGVACLRRCSQTTRGPEPERGAGHVAAPERGRNAAGDRPRPDAGELRRRRPARGGSGSRLGHPVQHLARPGDRRRVARTERDGAGHRDSPTGVPASRTVLAKAIDASGVTFYTNYDSAKSADLAANPVAGATFPWYALRRQVHVRGTVEKVDRATTEAYWRTRPRGSQLGAWASPQSTVLGGFPAGGAAPDLRAELDARQSAAEQRFERRAGCHGRRAGPVAGVLGRLADRAGDGGVLAGPGGQDARPAALPQDRRAVDRRAARPVTGCSARAANPPSGPAG